jgi:hypothetical protein
MLHHCSGKPPRCGVVSGRFGRLDAGYDAAFAPKWARWTKSLKALCRFSI